MHLQENIKTSLILSANTNIINDETFQKLLENCFAVLLKKTEVHSINSLYSSKPDVIKEVYAALLAGSAEFARNNLTKDAVIQFLASECKYSSSRANIYARFYEGNLQKLSVILKNIGTYLPHVVDVSWKIDYVVKSSSKKEGAAPLFQISLKTDNCDEETPEKKKENVCFTCTCQELQDLVYKLKDAVRHCQRLALEH